MNKHHREDSPKKRSGGSVGERKDKVSGYNSPGWSAVEKMLKGAHPTTHMGTVACSGGMGSHVMAEQKSMVEGGKSHPKKSGTKKHFAAGGAAKERKGQY